MKQIATAQQLAGHEMQNTQTHTHSHTLHIIYTMHSMAEARREPVSVTALRVKHWAYEIGASPPVIQKQTYMNINSTETHRSGVMMAL